MLNPDLFHRLEHFGLTDDHLEQLLAVFERRGVAKVSWHANPYGLEKVEVTLFATRRDSTSMRTLTHFVEQQ